MNTLKSEKYVSLNFLEQNTQECSSKIAQYMRVWENFGDFVYVHPRCLCLSFHIYLRRSHSNLAFSRHNFTMQLFWTKEIKLVLWNTTQTKLKISKLRHRITRANISVFLGRGGGIYTFTMCNNGRHDQHNTIASRFHSLRSPDPSTFIPLWFLTIYRDLH